MINLRELVMRRRNDFIKHGYNVENWLDGTKAIIVQKMWVRLQYFRKELIKIWKVAMKIEIDETMGE